MISSLFSGLSGVRSCQTQLEVIGNNISNTNTIGFKAGRVTFNDIFNQTLNSGKTSSNKSGGINPQQLGRGVKVGSIDTIFTQGSLQFTNKNTDQAIMGNGFFVLSDGANQYFTRAGDFDVNADGFLIGPNNLIVQGKMAINGVIAPGVSMGDIRLPINEKLPAKATTTVVLKGNLDANLSDTQSVDTTFNVFDSSGNTHTVTIKFTPGANNNWSWEASIADASIGSGTVGFNSDGSPIANTGDFTFTPPNGAADISITLDFGSENKHDGITNFPSDSTIMAPEQDGYAAGTLENFNFDDAGVIHGVFSNGETQVLAQLTLANFGNPAGLTKFGENLLIASANSGQVYFGQPGIEGLGLISPGSLELSNVALAEEFTNMILAQRGFQANANVITTTDTILGDIIQLKR